MQTIGECVGGPADGVQLDPDDPHEPDDWPDVIEIGRRNGPTGVYRLRCGNAKVRKGKRVYFFDHDTEE